MTFTRIFFKNTLYLYCICLLYVACTTTESNTQKQVDHFRTELNELKDYFHIPGMAALIQKDGEIIFEEYIGLADIKNNVPVDAQTPFPIASLTKMYASVAVMQLVESGKITLDDPIAPYFPGYGVDNTIKIKHLLSHTSQGTIGEQFYYSFRYGMLTKIIEDASGNSFDDAIDKGIFQPLQLSNTFLLKDSITLSHKRTPIAQPYLLNDGTEEGFIDYGFSASSGVVATPRDLALFNTALNNNTLVTQASKEQMFTPFKTHLPYGYGFFSEVFEGQELIWTYGQYDCYSALFLKIPSQKITLILLANNNLMSDPARLIYGNATSSLFVVSFLKNFIINQPELPLFETEATLKNTHSPSTLGREKLRAQAIAASFMARYNDEELKMSEQLLHKLFTTYPDYKNYADLSLLHNLSFLKVVSAHKELGPFTVFDTELESIGSQLLEKDSQNPYANVYMGGFYDTKNDTLKARYHYEQIINAQNFSPFWYTNEAKQWLDSHPE